MPDYPPEIRKAAAHAIDIERFRDPGYDGLVSGDPADLAGAVLNAVAADLGNAAAEKILAHMEASGPSVRVKLRGDAALKRHMRRLHFETAARIASRAFLTEEDTLRQVAGALERGDYVSCQAPEDADGR